MLGYYYTEPSNYSTFRMPKLNKNKKKEVRIKKRGEGEREGEGGDSKRVRKYILVYIHIKYYKTYYQIS